MGFISWQRESTNSYTAVGGSSCAFGVAAVYPTKIAMLSALTSTLQSPTPSLDSLQQINNNPS